MKPATILKISAFIAFSPVAFCAIEEVPSNSLQVEYKKSNEQSSNLLSLETVYQIPSSTYQYLDEIFTSFYNKLTFNTTIADSTFENNSHYELIAIPLIAENAKGLQIELFGNFSDPATQRLSNISNDQAMSNYYSNTELLDIYESSLSIGAGISFNASDDTKIKVIISNNSMPGYGSSNALLGFETSF
ncbi:hypothetical protein GCM10007916_27240 [Psychromonas marina]|uniref:Uncharacterized protein n=1 Tax=Psychromonas marina TaxID=88364 RepID=A0ABQ6E375_9GAMM|nr:hypothetical protein [Psychromonas marina]GLS91655.1 hypothetical protein GCM10007916_27240 [Psychromonas marina]